MFYGYYDYFQQPQVQSTTYITVAAVIGGIIGLILALTLFRKSNEGKFKGGTKKLYNFMTLNKFYTEDIIKILNVLTFFVVTAVGIALLVHGKWETGIIILVGVNIAARIVYELILMYVIQVRKTISVDRRTAAIERKLDKIQKFYEDEYEDFDDGECSMCESCSESSCEGCASFEENVEESSCEGCSESSCEGCASTEEKASMCAGCQESSCEGCDNYTVESSKPQENDKPANPPHVIVL